MRGFLSASNNNYRRNKWSDCCWLDTLFIGTLLWLLFWTLEATASHFHIIHHKKPNRKLVEVVLYDECTVLFDWLEGLPPYIHKYLYTHMCGCVCGIYLHWQTLSTYPACILQTLNRIVFQLCTLLTANILIYAESLTRTNDITQCAICRGMLCARHFVWFVIIRYAIQAAVFGEEISEQWISSYKAFLWWDFRLSHSAGCDDSCFGRVQLASSLLPFLCCRVFHCYPIELFWAINTML